MKFIVLPIEGSMNEEVFLTITGYLCPQCEKMHRVLSKIGQKHLPAKPPKNSRWAEAKP